MLREVVNLLEASGREGECYKFAYKYVKDHPDWKLVHGSVNNAPHHAWCEYHDDLVYDPVLDQTFVKDDYYERAQAKPVASYDLDTAMLKMVRARHYGPWESLDEIGLGNGMLDFNRTPFWREKAIDYKGKIIKASDVGMGSDGDVRPSHAGILHAARVNGLISWSQNLAAEMQGRGFIGWDGRYYSQANMEREIEDYLKRIVFHSEPEMALRSMTRKLEHVLTTAQEFDHG